MYITPIQPFLSGLYDPYNVTKPDLFEIVVTACRPSKLFEITIQDNKLV